MLFIYSGLVVSPSQAPPGTKHSPGNREHGLFLHQILAAGGKGQIDKIGGLGMKRNPGQSWQKLPFIQGRFCQDCLQGLHRLDPGKGHRIEASGLQS